MRCVQYFDDDGQSPVWTTEGSESEAEMSDSEPSLHSEASATTLIMGETSKSKRVSQLAA